MFGRTLKCSIAVDNGRRSEFIRQKTYPDKNTCYECGQQGHLSYQCEHNALGERSRPPKKERQSKKLPSGKKVSIEDDCSSEDEQSTRKERDTADEESQEWNDVETLSQAIQLEVQEADKTQGPLHSILEKAHQARKRIRPNAYLSDEEDISD